MNNERECVQCKKIKKKNKDFYKSSHPLHDGCTPICKPCIKNMNDYENINTIYSTLRLIDKPFIYDVWISSVEESKKRKMDLFGIYIKNINLNQYDGYTWEQSSFTSDKEELNKEESHEKEENIETNNETEELNDNNKLDVIRMIGYDPFEYEIEQDKKFLYSRLADFLDESTLEDSFKLQAVIEIVKGFNQIDKINQAITNITSDVDRLSNNSGGIKSLIDSKKNILSSLMKLAEDNGISVKHNNQKSKGAGTLTGIIKQLQEKGFEEAEINMFDIETAQGIRQVADLSNESIIKQLQFDENDYTEMINEQREMIQDLDSKVITLEEENRRLKQEMLKYKK